MSSLPRFTSSLPGSSVPGGRANLFCTPIARATAPAPLDRDFAAQTPFDVLRPPAPQSKVESHSFGVGNRFLICVPSQKLCQGKNPSNKSGNNPPKELCL